MKQLGHYKNEISFREQHSIVKNGLVISGLVLATLIPQLSLGHGYTYYPPSRAQICDSDGGYWDSQDGSTIPNAACRQAFLQSGGYAFYQKHEYAKLVADYGNINAVKSAVPGTTLCAAGDSAKSGMALAHPDWQKTNIDLSKNGGQIEFQFLATTPHDPSFWQFYLSKPGFDSSTQALSWNDVELIQENTNVPIRDIGGQKFYVMNLQLPTNRTGSAILYARWQRDDPAGEGFYNCSDLVFEGYGSGPSWFNQGSLISSQDDAKAGDEVWGRVFNSQGQEIVFEKLAITATNELETLWPATLATQITNAHPDVSVGVLNDQGDVVFNSADIYSNRVYSRTDADSYQLTIQVSSGGGSTCTDPNAGNYPAWQPGTYTNETVSHNGLVYRANWWTTSEPGTDNAWTLLSNVNLPWSASQVYQGGDEVDHGTNRFRASHWTQGDNPELGGVWTLIGPAMGC